jgi:hypothetical protein
VRAVVVVVVMMMMMMMPPPNDGGGGGGDDDDNDDNGAGVAPTLWQAPEKPKVEARGPDPPEPTGGGQETTVRVS